ncbi:MAG: pirin family protein [Candidatus Kapaibacterium sp.]
MANNKMIVDERSRDLGNFLVGRLLPFREKRQVGPFTFIDHMGPAEISEGTYFDVDQHPHIGLCTLTYLLEGEAEHHDSTGAHRIITPGSVNFMTAGKGVTHTERTPIHQRDGGRYRIHGYQVWVALPKELEEMEPTFTYVDKHDLPTWNENGLEFILVAGSGYGRTSPLAVHSPMFMLDITAQTESQLEIQGQVKGEIAFVVVHGTLNDGGEHISQGQMLISKTDNECSVTLTTGTRVLLFGGEPFPEERFMYWNFVSSSKERIEQAKQDWAQKLFPTVPGDTTYIPLPKQHL